MPIVRLIYVKVRPDQSEEAERLWKNNCAPLMIQQPGCISEKVLKCIDTPGEYISYSEWKDEKSVEEYRKSKAHEEIIKHTRTLPVPRPTVKLYQVGVDIE